jgi:transposase
MAARRSYPKEERETVLADVPALGVNAAAKKHDVPQTTLTNWAKAAGVQRAVAPSASSAPRAKARKSKEGARPRRKSKEPSAEEARREKPVVAVQAERDPKAPPATETRREEPVAATTQPPGRRPLKKRVAMIYTPSQKAEILEHAAAQGVTEASKKFSVSRYSIYGWQRKVSKAAVGNGTSPTSGPAPGELEAQRDKEILDEWHRHPGLGPSQIRNQLRRKGIRSSVNTVRRVMEGAGYRPPKVERKVHDHRYEATRPNHLWHLDFVQRFAEMRRRLAAHLHWYNHARTHHALGGLLVPADRYYGRVEEVLARIEAGAGRDAGDLLDLRDRCLELFKVTSKGGVAEVWLLGQRLLELPTGARP